MKCELNFAWNLTSGTGGTAFHICNEIEDIPLLVGPKKLFTYPRHGKETPRTK